MDMCRKILVFASVVVVGLAVTSRAGAQDATENHDKTPDAPVASMDILTPRQWRDIDTAVDRALAWLASQQQPDGSYLTLPSGQPGITGLAVMAHLAAGHVPGEGRHGRQLEQAIRFVLRTQQSDGMFSYVRPQGRASRGNASHAAAYNHAIAGLMLGEVYGMCGDDLNESIRPAIERGLAWTIGQQQYRKPRSEEQGGWRYWNRLDESDLSVTSWQIMFLRSAKNAQFDVPREPLQQAISFVRECCDSRTGAFLYRPPSVNSEPYLSRGMVGGGILILSLAGEHNTPMARRAGEWMLRRSFAQYNQGPDPYHYAAYYATQAMFQLGGKYWEGFYPELAQTLMRSQRGDGAWEPERHTNGIQFGSCYTTSLAVLALTTPYQLLPIYQR
jgi:hypothetical protein